MGNSENSEIKPKKKKGMSPFKIFTVYFFLGVIGIMVSGYLLFSHLSYNLPDLKALENIYEEQDLSTIIYSADGEVLRSLAKEKKRFWVTYNRIPQCMIDAVVAIEDQRFFKHWGISIPDILRAAMVDIRHMSFKQGGSTITQQLAKILYFSSEKKITRKLQEMITTIQIERTYTKSEILEMYLNKMELGNNTYGIQAAAQLYFGKDAEELNVSEAALFAGMFQNSSQHNPRSQTERRRESAKNRRNLVLRVMARAGMISYATAAYEIPRPIMLADRNDPALGKAYHFTEHVRKELYDTYGQDYVDTEGLSVHTTLDYRLQRVAEDSLRAHVEYIQKNYADRVIRYERPEGLTDAEAYRDSLDKTVVQGALIAMDVKTGKILAMVGGVGNEETNFFNRATQSERQAGSIFKPIVYAAALDNGWRCSDTILNGYVRYENVDGQGTIYEPQNFNKTYMGLIMSLRDGFKLSENIIAIRLVNDKDNRGIGPKIVIQYAREMGLTTPLDEVISLPVGTGHVKLIEMVSAFTIFPNLGKKTENFALSSIFNKNNKMIFSQPNQTGRKSEVLDPSVASLMITMMESVTKEGTASNIIRIKGLRDLPCAGKTGTGNEYKDAWFIGYTPHIVCGVWIGFDSEESTLGGNQYGTGATATLPVWVGFMKEATKIYGYGMDNFKYEGITSQRICRESYAKATSSCPDSSVYTEYYIPGTELDISCHIHGRKRRGF
ncbi:penicillin-binding protein 1A [Candidatus Latescibacterota bacterium]